VMRQANLELQTKLQEVTVAHHLKVATAYADYHREVLRIVGAAAEQEAAALRDSGAQSQGADVSFDDRFAAAQALLERLVGSRQASETAALAASRSLAEALHRAQLDAVDEYHAARMRYQDAVAGATASTVGPESFGLLGSALGRFAVAGDEGPAVVLPENRAAAGLWGSTHWSQWGF
jgi:hypothetical protein